MCLPIFIWGCKEMLILVGPTYAARLWCIIELFAFMQIKGSREHMHLIQVGHGVQPSPARRSGHTLNPPLVKFNVTTAECFKTYDKHVLLSAIEASFGELRPFNRIVGELLRDVDFDAHAQRA